MPLKNLIKIEDLERKDLEKLIEDAKAIKKDPAQFQDVLQHKIIATLFFEASTRTRLSFEAASKRLGAAVIGFSDASHTSYGSKGESLTDTIQVISRYVDLIVMRHPEAGAAKEAAQVGRVPLINAGDGGNEHPTQTLLDLMTIEETQGRLDNLKIALAGDLKYARVMRSLALALSLFEGIELYLVSPAELKMKADVLDKIKDKVKITETTDLSATIPEVDILYMIRIQKERFKDQTEAEKLVGSYQLTASMLESAKENMKILHCLPRLSEVEEAVDATPFAYYFNQAENGMWIRMALLKQFLNNA